MKKRQFSKALAMMMAAFVMVTSVFASDMTVEAASKKPAVTLSATSGTIAVGKTTTIKIKKATNKASKKIKDYKFTTSNKKVATVDSKGKVKGLKSGNATITLKSKKKVAGKYVTAKYKVKVVSVISKSISTAKSITVVQGKKTALKATVLPGNVSVKGVTYKTSYKKVATVDSKGNVKGVKAGSAKITITAKDGKAKATVNVKVIKKNSKEAKKLASKVSFKTGKVTLTEGQSYSQKASVKTKGKNKTVYYQSSNAKVATVDSKSGKVKAIAKGKATITAYATDGSNKSGKYTVTVNAKPAPAPQPKPTPNPQPQPQEVAVTGVSITDAPTAAIKYNAFAPIQLTAVVAPSNATNKTVTWSVAPNSAVTVDNKGLVKLNESFNTVEDSVSTVVTVTTANGKKATATITVVYSAKVDVVDDGTTYSVEANKDAVAYTVTRKDKVESVQASDLATDLATVAERLGNWDGTVAMLNDKINAHWGDDEATILDLVNTYSVIVGDATISEIKDKADVTFADDKYTIARGERTITVERALDEAGMNTFTITGVNANGNSKTIVISNIAAEKNGNDYVVSADVNYNNEEVKNVVVTATLESGVVTAAKVTTDSDTLVASYENTATSYKAVVNRTYYQNLREKLDITSDPISEVTIVENYK